MANDNEGETVMLDQTMDKLYCKVAWVLPRRLVYWAAIRLIAHATTGQYSDQEVPRLSATDALGRWR